MKLSILELSSSATVRNIRDIYRILGIKEKLVEKAKDKIILLGNGENDDKIIAMILHHLNGKKLLA